MTAQGGGGNRDYSTPSHHRVIWKYDIRTPYLKMSKFNMLWSNVAMCRKQCAVGLSGVANNIYTTKNCRVVS
jgi:hypothetical protein